MQAARMSRMSTRGQAVPPVDENAAAAPSLRSRKPAVASKAVTIKSAAVRATVKRTALGDLSNKTAAPIPAKVSKLATKPSTTRALSERRRSGSNPVVEQAKIEAVVKSAKESVASKATASKTAVCKPVDKRPVLAEIQEPQITDQAIATNQYWDDLDTCDLADPLMVAEYVVDIFAYMRVLELQTMPDPNYMHGQPALDWSMRNVIIDWMAEVHDKFHLLGETFYLAVNIFDRFLSQRVVVMDKLQLVAMTAIFIASKYEEVNHPSMRNFVDLVDIPFTESELRKSEIYVLQVLEFSLQYPNPMSYLRRISKAENYDLHSRTLAKYLIEVTLIDESFLGVTPSRLAAGGAYLARKMLGRELWNENLKFYGGEYEEKDVKHTAESIQAFLCKPVKHQTIFKKYQSKRYMKASTYVQEWVERLGGVESDEHVDEVDSDDN